MKNLLIGLFIIGLTSLSYSQNLYSEVEKGALEDNTRSSININYLTKVQNVKTSVNVKLFEDIVSRHDITTSLKFDRRVKPFKVKFITSNGSIIATYDQNGKILTSLEKFKNVDLPLHILKSISKEYPNASILSNTYLVSYKSNNDIIKRYTVKIKKDNVKKNLRIDSEGRIK